jgi:hypothetical protein
MICYHGTPVSGSIYDILPLFENRRWLVSVLYKNQLAIVKKASIGYILDNGAFTIWRRGKGNVCIASFKDFVLSNDTAVNYDWCFIPDIIEGSVEDNDKNIEIWLNCYGEYKSVPVFHYHEPLVRLKRLGEYFPIVALGSSAEYSVIGNVKWVKRTEEIFKFWLESIPNCKLHGLRMLNVRIFPKFHYYSGDSTNVGRNINLYMQRNGIDTRLNSGIRIANNIEKHKSKFIYESGI